MQVGDKDISPDETLSTAASGASPPERTITTTEDGPPPTPVKVAAFELPIVSDSVYQIEQEVGRGGVGVVVRAHDRRLGRRVALKQLQYLEPRARMRFEREMRITAKLQHPGVVPIHEAGVLESGAPFYAMKLIEGRSLKDLLGQCKTLEERLQLLPNLLAVVETIAYAHHEGVIHRDLKPSNVIVGSYGETVVIDWGLAKDLGAPDDAIPQTDPYRSPSRDDMTAIGSVVGTPAYMPPEQARGEEVDKRADVYALGAVIRQLLTAKLPYTVRTSEEMLGAVLAGPPPSLDEIARDVPRDLAAVANKAMAREASERYADAGGLLADLKSFVNGRLVSAYSYAATERLRKWAARRRGVIATAAVAGLLLLGVATVSAIRIVRERDAAIASRLATIEKSNALLREQAGREVDQRNVIRAYEILKAYPRDATDWDKVYPIIHRIGMAGLPDFWSYAAINGEKQLGFAVDQNSNSVIVANSKRLEMWGLDSRILEHTAPVAIDGSKLEIFDVRSDGAASLAVAALSSGQLVVIGLPLRSTRGPIVVQLRYRPCGAARISDFAFAPGQESIAVGCSDGRVVLLDVSNGKTLLLTKHRKGSASVVFLDKATVASVAADGSIKYSSVDTSSAAAPAEFDIGGNAGKLTSQFSCGRMALGTSDGRLIIVTNTDGARVSETYAIEPDTLTVALGIDHTCRLAFGLSASHHLVVVDLVARRILYSGRASAAHFYADRSALVTGSDDGEVEYWEPLTGWKQSWRVSLGQIRRIGVSPDGTIGVLGDLIASFSPSRIAHVHQLEQPSWALAAARDESRVLIGEIGGGVGLYDVDLDALTEYQGAHDGVVVARTGGEHSLYSIGGRDGCVRHWNHTASGRIGEPVVCVPGGSRDLAISTDDGQLYVLSNEGSLLGYTFANPDEYAVVNGLRDATRITEDPVHGQLVLSHFSGEIEFLSRHLAIQSSVALGVNTTAAFVLPSGRSVALAATGQVLAIPRTGIPEVLAKCSGMLSRPWISHDKDVLFASCEDGTVIAWPRVEGLDRIAFEGATSDVDGDPIGDRVASCSMSGAAAIIDMRHRNVLSLSSSIPLDNLELLSKHGKLIASAHEHGLVAIWDLANQPVPYPLDYADIFQWLHSRGD